MKELIVNSLIGFLEILQFLILIRVVISWVTPSRGYQKIVNLIYELTDPILNPIKKVLEKYQGNMGLDFSPIVAFLIINLLQEIVARI